MGALLSQVQPHTNTKPPRIVIHGKGGVGKTTFGATVPGCLFLPAEDGLGRLTVPCLPKPETFMDVLFSIAELASEVHDYRALIVDTIDHIEPLVWGQVCQDRSDKKTYESIEDFGYQKGYIHADPYWLRLFRGLDLLRAKGMTIFILSHNELKTINDPVTGPYDAVQPKLHKRAKALLYEYADIVGYLDIEKAAIELEGGSRKMQTAQSLGDRVLYLDPGGGYEAKNRYGLPTRIKIPEDNAYGALRDAIVKTLGTAKKEAA